MLATADIAGEGEVNSSTLNCSEHLKLSPGLLPPKMLQAELSSEGSLCSALWGKGWPEGRFSIDSLILKVHFLHGAGLFFLDVVLAFFFPFPLTQ